MLNALAVSPQMVSCSTLAFVAASLLAVASAAAPDINVVVGNFALNLVSNSCAKSPDDSLETCWDLNDFQDGTARVTMTNERGNISSL